MIQPSTHRAKVDFLYLSSSAFIVQGLGMVRSFAVARLLGPVMFGTIQALNIFLLYVPLVQMGYFQSMERDLPRLLEAQDETNVNRITQNDL